MHYVCGGIGKPDMHNVWGGTLATNYIIKKAFENSTKYDLVIRGRLEFENISKVKEFLDKGDISWLDETSLLGEMFTAGYDRPTLIGPITRSPIKNYNGGNWNSVYTKDWFYTGHILRLNENEEKPGARKLEFKSDKTDYMEKIDYIRHGIDTELLLPTPDKEKKYVLWAGMANRPAKNFKMFEDIKYFINLYGGLPYGYAIRQMSNYPIGKFWEVLDETVVYVNTSLYESFCNAANEARSKGVPTIVRDFLTGIVMYRDQPIQVPYDPADYAKKIIQICKDKNTYIKESKIARNWVVKNCALDVMRKDIEKVFGMIIKEQK